MRLDSVFLLDLFGDLGGALFAGNIINHHVGAFTSKLLGY